MNSIEERLRDAMAARAEIVGDDDRPLPAPRPRRSSRGGLVRVAAVALTVAATALGVARLAAPLLEPQESIVAMSLSGTVSSGGPEVAVFLCKDGDSLTSCAGGGEITKTEWKDLERALEARPEVESVRFEDRQQAWENFRRHYKDNPELLKATTPTDMPESFRARIRAGAKPSTVAQAASELPGVSMSVDQACLIDNSPPWGIVKRLLGRGEQCSFTGKGR
ncbi:permease-like cell division protein FtsX [Nonomuraea sp. NPDC026600]|uniref:permease-like cell division protein FtsX n=1 Tax=Nonomuraea sp. NPDC026600 TaxID=3155363 RepID=UPI0033F54811